MNIEPAPQTTSNSSNQDNWRANPDGSTASSRVESISFSIGDEQYGVDIMAVREIKGWSEITHLPKQPDYVRGVLNLRGVMVPIIDLRCRFGQGKTEATALHIVIVVQVEARLIGLLARRRFGRRRAGGTPDALLSMLPQSALVPLQRTHLDPVDELGRLRDVEPVSRLKLPFGLRASA